MNALETNIQKLIGRPVANDELAEMSRIFVGAMRCLTICIIEAKNEGRNINKSINEGARGRPQPTGSKYAPFRLCEKKTA